MLLTPVPGEKIEVLGEPFGGPCAFRVESGLPCPMCGMTRSWAWATRGEPVRAFAYNPAGATLWGGLVLCGIIGLSRLVSGDPKRLAVPWQLLVGATIVWLGPLYAGVWLLRTQGFFALP